MMANCCVGSYRFLYRVMKAVVRSAGSMLFKDGVSQPSSCGSKEVLVDVKAAGINPVDYKVLLPSLNISQ